MNSVSCQLTGEIITGGMPNFGRGVHNLVLDVGKDINVNVFFLGSGHAVAQPTTLGNMWGQNTGGVNLSKAGLVAALLAAQTIGNLVQDAISNVQDSTRIVPASVCDLTGETINAGTRNYGRGTAIVNVGTSIQMHVSFFRGDAGGVNLSQAGFIAAMALAQTKAGGLTDTKSTGLLTLTGVGTANDTVTVGDVTYTLKANPNAANEVKIGANAGETAINLADAINGSAAAITAGRIGAGTVANPKASAVASAQTVQLTSKLTGTTGNAVATAEASTAMSFGAATLTTGVNASLAGTQSGNHIATGEPGTLTMETAGVTRPS